MARSGVSPYRAIDDRRKRWELEHPKEAYICGRIALINRQLDQWGARIAWTDRICAKTGRGVNERYHKCVRGLAHLARMKGALELKLKEMAE